MSITRQHLRRRRLFPAFVWHTWHSLRQLRSAPGLLSGWLAGGPGAVGHWTITLWTGVDALRAYRGAGAHAAAMPHLRDWCDEAAVAHWTKERAAPPSLAAVAAGLRSHGRTSPLRRPSAAHARGGVCPDGQAPQGGLPIRPATRARPVPGARA